MNDRVDQLSGAEYFASVFGTEKDKVSFCKLSELNINDFRV